MRGAAAPADLVELGRVTAAYGVKGWIKIQPHSAQAEVLRSVKQWWLSRPVPALARSPGAPEAAAAGAVSYQVLQARAHGATVVAQLAGVADRDQAEALRGCLVLASRSAFPQPDEGEYYWVDLIGCDFYTAGEAGQPRLFGRVEEVLDNGAHAILRIARVRVSPEGEAQPMLDAKGRAVETLVPFVDAHVHTVDISARRIDGDWPDDF